MRNNKDKGITTGRGTALYSLQNASTHTYHLLAEGYSQRRADLNSEIDSSLISTKKFHPHLLCHDFYRFPKDLRP